MDRTDRLGRRARWALGLAEEMAARRGADTTPAHVLLGLLHIGNTSALRLLHVLGVNTRELGATVTGILTGRPATLGGAGGYTLVSELADDAEAEALREGRIRVATHHLLIAVVRRADDDMRQALIEQGVTVTRLRTVVDLLFHGDSDPDRERAIAPEPAWRPGLIEEAQRVQSGISPTLGAALAPSVQRALMVAWVTASRERRVPVGPAQIAQALLAVDSELATALQCHGLDLTALRAALDHIIAVGTV